MPKLTKAQRIWFQHALGHSGVCYNPYSSPGAAERWRKMAAKSVNQGLVRPLTDAWATIRGGGFEMIDAGRAALAQQGTET